MKKLLFVLLLSAVALGFVMDSILADEAKPQPATSVSAVPLGQAAVLEVVDVLHFKDGKQVTGRIVATGAKAVVIIVEENGTVSEKSYPRADVTKIERGKAKPKADYYQTGSVDGKEKITKAADASSSSSTATTSARPGTSSAPKPTGLSVSAKSDTIIAELIKDKNFSGLVRVLGYARVKQLIDNAKNGPQFAKMIDNFNKNGRIEAADLADVINNTRLQLDSDTDKKLKKFLSDLTEKPLV